MSYQVFTYDTSGDALLRHLKLFLTPEFTPRYLHGTRIFDDNHRIIVRNPTPVNLGLVGFGEQRWRKFWSEYIDQRSFRAFMRLLPKLEPGRTIGYTCPVRADHEHGNCIMGIVAYRTETENIVHMHSRASMWIPTGALDLALGSLICMAWDEATDAGDWAELRWSIEQLQVSSWKSLPLIIRMAHEESPGNPEASSWLQPLVTSHPVPNKFVNGYMRRVYHQLRNPHEVINRTYQMLHRSIKKVGVVEHQIERGQIFPIYYPNLLL